MQLRNEGTYSVIDLGTNTCLLLIAQLENKKLTSLYEAQETPRIGRGIYDSGQISSESFDKALTIFKNYKHISEEYSVKCIYAFGTSALRDAVNSEEFIGFIESRTGIRIKVISGEQEAEYAFCGAVFDLPENNYAVIDIGGGSTELTFRIDEVLISKSIDIGSVRLTEKFFRIGYSQDAVRNAKEYISKSVEKLIPASGKRKLVGVAGTITTLSAIKNGMKEFEFSRIHGDVISLEDISEISERLMKMNEAGRLSIGNFMKGRSDIITAGSLILKMLMERLGAGEIIVSAKGLRYGLMLNLDDFSYRT